MDSSREKQWSNLLGNHESYSPEYVLPLSNSPLEGKHIAFLGSSVTRGAGGMGISFVEFLAARNKFVYTKEAVDGTTMTNNGSSCYIERMHTQMSQESHFDVFVCQLSTNDAKLMRQIGAISTHRSLREFNQMTIAGAIEYIIAYASYVWKCPVVFFTTTQYNSDLYANMVKLLYNLQSKWNISIIDLWNDHDINYSIKQQQELYMCDKIHPTRAGYLEIWTPKFEKNLCECINNAK